MAVSQLDCRMARSSVHRLSECLHRHSLYPSVLGRLAELSAPDVQSALAKDCCEKHALTCRLKLLPAARGSSKSSAKASTSCTGVELSGRTGCLTGEELIQQSTMFGAVHYDKLHTQVASAYKFSKARKPRASWISHHAVHCHCGSGLPVIHEAECYGSRQCGRLPWGPARGELKWLASFIASGWRQF